MLILCMKKKNQDKKLKLSSFRVGFMFFGLRRSRQTDRHVGHPVCFVSIDNNYVTIVCLIVHTHASPTPNSRNLQRLSHYSPGLQSLLPPGIGQKKFSMSGVATCKVGGVQGGLCFQKKWLTVLKLIISWTKYRKEMTGKIENVWSWA